MNDAALCRLLDNRWHILLSKDVAGRYFAAAKHPMRETWKDVFECVDDSGQPADFPMTDLEWAKGYHSRMPHRIATAATPTEALAKLADQVLGLGAPP